VSFDGFLGNPGAVARLRALAAGGRRAHAYVFAGPDGVGKKRAALAFAEALGARTTLVERPEDRHEILIAQVREVIRELGLTSAARRAVVFDEAERMSEEAMNALLKTLEEPPAGAFLILVTRTPERLLGTIRSRCQTIHFFPLPDEELEALARSGSGLAPEDARAAAALSDGSVGRLRELAPEIGAIRKEAAELQARVLAGELNPVVEALGRIRDTEESRRRAKRQLGLLLQCLRESLRLRSGGAPALATPGFLERMGKLDEDEVLEKMESLLDHGRAIDLNANVGLAVEDALLRL
jgi:DNA polymerase-3 subunit delta'